MTARASLVLVLALAALLRAPFLLRALDTPVDADTAIVGLMARHPGEGTTLWGQPYGSPLDAWVATPFVHALGSTRAALRLPYFLLGLALVPLAFFVARRIDPAAALPAACLVAIAPAYFVILSALPPPLYGTTLVLLGLVLVLTLRMAAADVGRPPWIALALWGAAAGLALWTHLMSASVIAPAAASLVARWRRRPGPLLVALAALAVTSAPWWSRLPGDPSALWAVSTEREGTATSARIARTMKSLHQPFGVLVGTRTPLTPDDADRTAAAPRAVAVLLALAYVAALAGALRQHRRPGVRLLVAVVVLTVVVFPVPVRAGPDTPRFLTPAFLPLVVLAAVGATAWGGKTKWALVVAIAAGHLVATTQALAAWRDPGVELAPDCSAVREVLTEAGITRAYASYNMAYCLTYESGEAIVASQPWNERFFGYPLPYRREVQFAHDAAWVLVPGADFGLPSPRHFESRLRAMGGTWTRREVAGAVVFHSFVPPFGPEVVTLAPLGPLGDGHLETRVAYPAQAAVTLALPAPTPISAVTVIAAQGELRLPEDLTLEVSPDGVTFERVFRRRPGRELVDLFWINGHPQHAGHDFLSVGLDGRTAVALRVLSAGTRPWALEEVLLHPSAAPRRWDEWVPASGWDARREALRQHPRPDRADWYFRLLLVAGNR